MDQTADYITKEKRKALEIELEDLRGPQRKEILASLEYAKSLGDLAENAEYHQAREDQGKLEERIAKIEQIFQSSKNNPWDHDNGSNRKPEEEHADRI